MAKVTFSDLTHTGQVVAANTFPLGSAMIAAYAKQELKEEIDIAVFRYPEDLNRHLTEHGIPQIACFTVFAWNMSLAHTFAQRMKDVAPNTITVFGGPNYPNVKDEQHEFLRYYPAIDLAVEGEGEVAFVEIFRTLKSYGFDFARLKAERVKLPNTAYRCNGEMIVGEMLPRIEDLNVVPSVYENNLCDKFFDEKLIPMIQTARGCPYSCTFCHEGSLYFSKTKRFSQDRVHKELDYIAERAKAPDFIIVDLNFGMFELDIDTSKHIARIQQEREWPKFVTIATAKNHKERVLDISKLLKGSLPPGAAVQSTDPEVLKIIKRKNLPMEAVIEVARTAETDGAVSFSEVILCLPGDSKRAHFKSVIDTINAGFTLVRMYQFMMLAGTEAAGKASRKLFNMTTRFRVKPMNFGRYDILGKMMPVAEVEEICVANKTMPYNDYQDCRWLNLTVEIFNNNGIFFDLLQFLAKRGVNRADFVMAVYEDAIRHPTFSKLYHEYRAEEEHNLWTSQEEVEAFIQKPGVIQQYLDGDHGTNEIYKYRALALFEHSDALHAIAFGAARRLLEAKEQATPDNLRYLVELAAFSSMRKRDFMNTSVSKRSKFHYDFVRLTEANFAPDPMTLYRPDGVEIEAYHTDFQTRVIDGYKGQFGTTLVGIGRILNRAHISSMYRAARYAQEQPERAAVA